jgi:hypothetical protein
MTRQRFHSALLLLALLAGCSTVRDLNPFGDKSGGEIDRRPANATEYRCDQNKSFFVRQLEPGTVWLIAPDREIRLSLLSKNGVERYGVGRVELEIKGEAATLTDPPSQFVGCKRFTGK